MNGIRGRSHSGRAGPRGAVVIGFACAVSLASVHVAHAAGRDALSFPDGASTATFGPSAIVRIDGAMTFEADCGESGIDDFVFPATDVYIVPAGSVGGILTPLADAGGGRPNTIVSTATVFTDEIIAVTTPAGALGEGVYDVIYDTCQDGFFDEETDTRFPNAITVVLPELILLPPGSDAISKMKQDAFLDYLSWLATRGAMQGIFKLADQALKANCQVGNSVACALRQVGFYDRIKPRVLALMLNQANHYLAIHGDPPDPAFRQLTTVVVSPEPAMNSSSATATAISDALAPLATETALSEAMLHAVERYQGAVAAGDRSWALLHARAAANLTSVLTKAQEATSSAFGAIRDAAAADADLESAIEYGREFAFRMWQSGFEADERRTLRNLGFDSTAIARLETELQDSSGPSLSRFLEALDAVLEAHAGLRVATGASSSTWAVVAGQITATTSASTLGVDAGGPYSVTEGESVTLLGSAATVVDEALWDLDADGAFDDGAGLAPTVQFDRAGGRVIGLRVTREGATEVAYAFVEVSDAVHPPVVSDSTPAATGVRMTVGTALTFSVTASDPEGDPLTFRWSLDGEPIPAAGASHEYVPELAAVGLHTLDVEVSDETAGGGSVHATWDVAVAAPDADLDGWTRTSDCDDGDAAIHPTANELLGNGIDDDCDAGTPDAPPGGLTGSIMTWGERIGVGVSALPGRFVPVPLPIPDFDDVVQVDSRLQGGIALLSSGEVINWGSNLEGEIGAGTSTFPTVVSFPVYPLTVGGGEGRLAGITQVSGSGGLFVAARRADGSVVSWGSNASRQLGDGSTVRFRAYPVEMLSGPGGPPLTGVRAVETGYLETYLLMEDTTVKVVGQDRCSGGNTITVRPYPTTLTLVGGNVRQVASGVQWTLFLKKDGSVLSSGAFPPYAARPVLSVSDAYTPGIVTGFGPGSGVIDIAVGAEGAAMLKDDGSVWMWGSNANGSLTAIGAAPGQNVFFPVQAPLPPGPPVIDIAMDVACHILALRADGSLLGWGCDWFEQVGNGAGPASQVVAEPTVLDMSGRSVIRVDNSTWNSLALTRPMDDSSWERPATWVEASIEDAEVGEATPASFRVSLSHPFAMDVTVEWVAEPETAGSADLGAPSGSVTIPAGSTSAEAIVPLVDDGIDEEDETFTVRLVDASNGIRFGRAAAHGTIIDDDAEPSLSIEPLTVAEGDSTITDAAVMVRLSAPSGKTVALEFATADGAATAGVDYIAAAGQLLFPPGVTEMAIHVVVRGDRVAEPSKQFTVTLSASENAGIATASAAVTIVDDEILILELTSPAVLEGDSGSTPATFLLALVPPAPPGTSVSVSYTALGQTAFVPDDVSPASGVVTFGPGDGPQEITVEVRGDTIQESRESFRLDLAILEVEGGRTVVVGDNLPAFIVDDDGAVPGGRQKPCDCNGDLALDISDPICLLIELFLDSPRRLPCGGGETRDPGNIRLMDCNEDRSVDLSDVVCILQFIFLDGPPPAECRGNPGCPCIDIPGCPSRCP